MAEDDDWEGREGRWTRSSESSEGGDGERYYELPDGEIVQGEPEGDVEAEPVEPPEEEEGGLAGLFGGDDEDEEPDEEIEEDEEDDDGSIVPIVAGVVVLLLVLLVLLVAAAFLGIADPLGIGPDDGADDGGGGGDNGDGGGGGNDTELFNYPVNWTASSNSVERSSDGRLQQGNSTTVEIDIARLNVTGATLTFTWDDSDDDEPTDPILSNEPDNFTVTVTAPDGSSDEGTAENGDDGQGEIVLNLSLAEVPVPTSVTAPNETAAEENVAAQYPPNPAGFGNWTVEITLNSAPPCQSVQDQTEGDCGEDWQLSLEYAWYEHLLGTPTEVES